MSLRLAANVILIVYEGFQMVKLYLSLILFSASLAFSSGCGGKQNTVVGESNGWTMEDYRKAVAKESETASEATP